MAPAEGQQEVGISNGEISEGLQHRTESNGWRCQYQRGSRLGSDVKAQEERGLSQKAHGERFMCFNQCHKIADTHLAQSHYPFGK